VALELALKLEAQGRDGNVYLVDSAPDFLKETVAHLGRSEDKSLTSVLCTMLKHTGPDEATSSSVSEVYDKRNVKSYEYWNAVSIRVWPFKFVAVTYGWGYFHSNAQFCSWSYYNYIVFNTLVS
jgi:hypothetical protein